MVFSAVLVEELLEDVAEASSEEVSAIYSILVDAIKVWLAGMAVYILLKLFRKRVCSNKNLALDIRVL